MAVFKDGAGVQSAIIDVIKNAEKELFLISPYLKIPVQTKNYLKSIDNKNIPITIIYRSDFKLSEDDLKFFTELSNLQLYLCDNLHAKCYLNEKWGLITSMNLHEHSQTHNWEMGVVFSKQYDYQVYDDVRKELSHLMSQGKLHSLKKKGSEVKQQSQNKSPQKMAYKPKEAPNKGIINTILDSITGEAAFCIRCGDAMQKYNLEKPLCDRCYPRWAKYKDITYKEKFCHYCGEQRPNISYEKPICIDCFKHLYK
jgi:phosphatidylserine/phosphatidylglycerophosphate/cardiolipin synthase-like enzyme